MLSQLEEAPLDPAFALPVDGAKSETACGETTSVGWTEMEGADNSGGLLMVIVSCSGWLRQISQGLVQG